MGEESKKSGDFGERMAKQLLRSIGWTNLSGNLKIACIDESHLGKTGNPRQTHGDDVLFIYHNPFHDDCTEVVHVSAKHTVRKYPAKDSLKRTFKKHLEELVQTIECAQHAHNVHEAIESYGPRKNLHHSGILIWLQNDNESPRQDIKFDLSNANIPLKFDFPVYLIDNARADFLINVVHDLENREGTYEFFFPRTGTSLSEQNGRTGRRLPAELIGADVVPAVVRKDDVPELIVYSTDNFDVEAYKKLISYGMAFANGIAKTVRIGFSDYNPAHHEELAVQAQGAFHDREEKVRPFRYGKSIVNLIPEEA